MQKPTIFGNFLDFYPLKHKRCPLNAPPPKKKKKKVLPLPGTTVAMIICGTVDVMFIEIQNLITAFHFHYLIVSLHVTTYRTCPKISVQVIVEFSQVVNRTGFVANSKRPLFIIQKMHLHLRISVHFYPQKLVKVFSSKSAVTAQRQLHFTVNNRGRFE